MIADHNTSSLNLPTSHFNAPHGTNGGSGGLTGKSGDSVFIKVPLGSIVRDVTWDDRGMGMDMDSDMEDDGDGHGDGDGEYGDVTTKKTVHLDKDKDMVLVARGGRGGQGNMSIAGSKNRLMSLVSLAFIHHMPNTLHLSPYTIPLIFL